MYQSINIFSFTIQRFQVDRAARCQRCTPPDELIRWCEVCNFLFQSRDVKRVTQKVFVDPNEKFGAG